MNTDENFLEYYEKYKDLIDAIIPKAVLGRLLNNARKEAVHGDAWEG
jgi:histone H3/H4